jgi:hypothetical protein
LPFSAQIYQENMLHKIINSFQMTSSLLHLSRHHQLDFAKTHKTEAYDHHGFHRYHAQNYQMSLPYQKEV